MKYEMILGLFEGLAEANTCFLQTISGHKPKF